MDIVLVLILSFDTLLACMAYGVKQIKIPLGSKLIITVVGSACFGLSLFLSQQLADYLPSTAIKLIGFFTLALLGIMNLAEGLLKRFVTKYLPLERSMRVSCVRFTLNIYADKTCADRDESHSLSGLESLFLAFPLSLDSLISGLSISSASFFHSALLIGLSFFCGLCACVIGVLIGKRMQHSIHTDLSWISGVLLLFLAIGKLCS